MNTPSRLPQTPAGRRRQLTDRLRAEAQRRGVPVVDVRKQYVFALFYKRLGQVPGSGVAILR